MKIYTHIKNLPNHIKYQKISFAVDQFLTDKKYVKVDCPVLAPVLVPESYLEVFESEFRYFDQKNKLYLTPSPELFLKRVLAYGGLDCYYLGKSFRNSESYSSLHSFEFTMLEFYKTKADYMDIASELLKMMRYISQKLYQSDSITYQGKKVSFTKWEKISVTEAFQKYAGITEEELFDHEKFMKKCEQKGHRTQGFTYEDLFSQLYTQEIEPNLGVNGSPTLLYDYPKEFAALAKLNPDRKTAQRFEFYINGIELGDCYTELTDWQEQEERFANEDQARKKTQKINHPVDTGFIEALQHGLIDCSGIAVGFDRLAMVYANATSIHDLKLIDVY